MGDFVSFWDLIMLAILIWAGGYALYSAIRLKKEYYLYDNRLLYPGKCDPAACTDPSAFIEYIFPRILGLGIAVLIFAAMYAIVNYTDILPSADWFGYLVMPVTGVAIFVWYILMINKAAKKFWPNSSDGVRK